MSCGGGQGRNRTADASLFRAVRLTSYRPVDRIFIDLRPKYLVSTWTPGRSLIGVGLRVDSGFMSHSRSPSTWTPAIRFSREKLVQFWYFTCSRARSPGIFDSSSSSSSGKKNGFPIYGEFLSRTPAAAVGGRPGTGARPQADGVWDILRRLGATRSDVED